MVQRKRLPDDVLAAHAGSLRLLARHLAFDHHGAEDAVQDAWVVALEHPPAHTEQVGGWLRTVLRRQVANRRRAEGRRRARERAAARPERAPECGDERARTLRTVVAAVLELPEPFRGTVLSHYFEDLSPLEIAARDGLSVETVRSRLFRARARLRSRLEREFGDETGGSWSALLLFAGAGREPALAGGASSGLLSAAGGAEAALAASTVVFALLGGWAGWFALDAQPARALAAAPSAQGMGAARVPATRTGAPAADELPTASDPRELAAPARDSLWPAPEEPYALSVRVRGADGLPAAQARVFVCALAGGLQPAGLTDGAGQLALEWRGREARMPIVVAVLAAGHTGGPWRLELDSGSAAAVDLHAAVPLDVDPAGDASALRAGSSAALSSLEWLTALAVPAPVGPGPFEFVEPHQAARVTFAKKSERFASGSALSPGELDEVLFENWQEVRSSELAVELERLRDAPMPQAGLGRVVRGAPGPERVVAHWGGASATDKHPAGVRLTALELLGGVTRVTHAARGVGGSPSFFRGVVGPALLFACDPRGGEVLPRLLAPGSRPGVEALPGDGSPAPPGGLRARVVDAAGRALPTAEVRVWTRWPGAVQRAAFAPPGARPGEFDLAGLPAGTYRLQVREPVHGGIAGHAFEVAPGLTTDLGELVLSEPAWLALEVPCTAEGAYVLRRVGPHVETLLGTLEPGPSELALPAGDYLVHSRGDRAQAVALELRAGERRALDLRALAPR